jgi:CDP-6-deoxy-D-xylo-4-hexulose-3-dehydrase
VFVNYEEFFHLPRAREHSDPSWFAFPVTIKKGSPFTRTEIVDFLEDAKIQTRPYFAGNIMLQPAYDHLMDPNETREMFPVATYVMLNTFFLGTSPVVSLEQIAYIKTIVDNFMSKYV